MSHLNIFSFFSLINHESILEIKFWLPEIINLIVVNYINNRELQQIYWGIVFFLLWIAQKSSKRIPELEICMYDCCCIYICEVSEKTWWEKRHYLWISLDIRHHLNVPASNMHQHFLIWVFHSQFLKYNTNSPTWKNKWKILLSQTNFRSFPVFLIDNFL